MLLTNIKSSRTDSQHGSNHVAWRDLTNLCDRIRYFIIYFICLNSMNFDDATFVCGEKKG